MNVSCGEARPDGRDMKSVKLRVLTWMLFIIAATILYWAVAVLPHQTGTRDVLLLTVLAILTVPFGIILPKTGTLVLFGDTYLMALAIMKGPAACVAGTLCVTLFVLAFTRKCPWRIFLFNLASMVCVAFLYSSVYRFLKPTNDDRITAILLPSLVMALVLFSVGTVLASTVATWATGKETILGRFRQYLPLLPNELIAAVAATIMTANYHRGPFAVLVVAPLIGLTWGYTRMLGSRLARKSAN